MEGERWSGLIDYAALCAKSRQRSVTLIPTTMKSESYNKKASIEAKCQLYCYFLVCPPKVVAPICLETIYKMCAAHMKVA